MNWTEPKPPTKGESYYNHVKCDTPIGLLYIKWTSWKDNPSYSVMLEDTWITDGISLEDAKSLAESYIDKVIDELIEIRNR